MGGQSLAALHRRRPGGTGGVKRAFLAAFLLPAARSAPPAAPARPHPHRPHRRRPADPAGPSTARSTSSRTPPGNRARNGSRWTCGPTSRARSSRNWTRYSRSARLPGRSVPRRGRSEAEVRGDLRPRPATAAELGDGRVLVVDGYGHTSLDVPSSCASAAVLRYLAELAVPPAGTACARTRPVPLTRWWGKNRVPARFLTHGPPRRADQPNGPGEQGPKTLPRYRAGWCHRRVQARRRAGAGTSGPGGPHAFSTR
ncbi:alpha/beta hydrolase [Amycolatopsis sp. cmx-4-61]|uniref:alpha/beta hydrolase n=1 Tax=Amycolatopsis sp. cmx-4-61 TaxID=2790937 RepID=UPI0039782366